MSLKIYPNVVDSTDPGRCLNKRENDEVTQISMLTDKSTSVKGYILVDFDAKLFQYKSSGCDGRVKSWILADYRDSVADV